MVCDDYSIFKDYNTSISATDPEFLADINITAFALFYLHFPSLSLPNHSFSTFYSNLINTHIQTPLYT